MRKKERLCFHNYRKQRRFLFLKSYNVLAGGGGESALEHGMADDTIGIAPGLPELIVPRAAGHFGQALQQRRADGGIMIGLCSVINVA